MILARHVQHVKMADAGDCWVSERREPIFALVKPSAVSIKCPAADQAAR
jgi:hypothetical protein